MVSLRLNVFLVEQISLVGYWKWDEMACLRYLSELDGFLHKHQDFILVKKITGHSTYDAPLVISYTLWMKFIHTKKTYTAPLSIGELASLWILLSSCCISENMGIFPLPNDPKLSDNLSTNVDPYKVVLDFRYFALFFFLQMRYCLKTCMFSRPFPQVNHHPSTLITNLNSSEYLRTGTPKQHKTTIHSFDSTYRPLVLTPRSKSLTSLKSSDSFLGASSHSNLSNDSKVSLGHEKDTPVYTSCTKTRALFDFVMNKFNILLRIVHRHYLSDIHHVIPEHLNVLLLLMNPVNDEFEAPSYHLKNIQDVLEVFSTRIPEREDVWSPVLVEQYLLRALSHEHVSKRSTRELNHSSEDCIIVEGYQHETKVYYEQKSSQKIAHATTSGEKNYQWNTLKSFRSFWLRDIAFSQIYIFHSRVKHVRIQNCSHACILVPAISGILLVINCTHIEIMTTCRCLKIKDSSFVKINSFTWTSPIITGICKDILLGPYNVLFSKQKEYMKLNSLWCPSRCLTQWANPTKVISHQDDKSSESQNTFNSTEQTAESCQYVVNSMNVPYTVQTKSLKNDSVYSLVSPDIFCPFVMPERHLLLDPHKLLRKYSLMLPEMYRLSLGENQKKVQEQLEKIKQLCDDQQQMYRENVCSILHQNFLKWLERSGHMGELFNISRFTTPGYFQ